MGALPLQRGRLTTLQSGWERIEAFLVGQGEQQIQIDLRRVSEVRLKMQKPKVKKKAAKAVAYFLRLGTRRALLASTDA